MAVKLIPMVRALHESQLFTGPSGDCRVSFVCQQVNAEGPGVAFTL